MTRFTAWMTQKWARRLDPGLVQAYQVTFNSLHGRAVLQHLLDEIYCQVCLSKDPIDLSTHNARRSVVHEILENIDMADHPPQPFTEE